MTVEQLSKLVNSHAQTRDDVIASAISEIDDLFRELDQYDPEATTEAALDAALVVREAQDVVAEAAVQYLDDVFAELEQPLSDPVTTDLESLFRDLNVIEQWHRPGEQYRYAKSAGENEAAARKKAADRAHQMVEQDIALANRGAQQQVYQASKVVFGYRRVVHPELSRYGVCGLCIVASDRLYKKADLLPLHPGCRCETLPEFRGEDDPRRLVSIDLSAIYAAADSNRKQELSRTRVQVTDSGELGPVLIRAGEAYVPRKDRYRAPAKVRAAELKVLRRRLQQVSRTTPAYQWIQDRIRELNKEGS